MLGKLCPLPPAFQRLSSAPRTSAASPGPARTTARAPFPVEEESGEEDGYLTQGEEEKGAELGYRRSHTWGTAAPASEPAIQQLEEQLDEEELLEEPGDVDDDVEQALLDRILEQATPPEQARVSCSPPSGVQQTKRLFLMYALHACH